jgi:hypothetical protein
MRHENLNDLSKLSRSMREAMIKGTLKELDLAN